MKILSVMSADGICGYYAKGHVDEKDFLQAVKAHIVVSDYFEFSEELRSLGKVTNEHWRVVPRPNSWELSSQFYKANEGERGVFPVTVVENELGFAR